MLDKNLNKFFLGIIAPSILAMILFIISFFVFIIPQFERNMMDRKKEMIRELTNTALSLIKQQQLDVERGDVSFELAQKNAAMQIEQLRYGAEGKDYFWIIDYSPRMIMHPYRKELIGTNLSDFKDSHEKKLFVDAASLVKEKGEGFINYYWQWKDDTTRIVPKLSYVKGDDQWQWLVGTGIYLDDVKKEIGQLKNRLLKISAFIFGIILMILFYIIRQSLIIEHQRKAAEQKLLLSKQKYKTLVEASTEGTLMFMDKKVIFNNFKFSQMIDSPAKDLTGYGFNDIFEIEWDTVLGLFSNPKQSVTTETILQLNGSINKEVVISVSRIDYSNQEAFIVVARDVSTQKQMEKSTQKLSQELQTSLLLMNQPIKSFLREIITCSLETTIQEAATFMTVKNQKVVFIKNGETIIGAVNDADLKKRVLARDLNSSSRVAEIMSAPVVHISENALLYEAILLFKREKVSHLLVKDSQNRMAGSISFQDALEMQQNSLSYLIREIENSNHVEELKHIYQRVPVLVHAIIANSDNALNTTRIITSVADAITSRVINLAIESHGTPPVPFAFISMGSEGRMEQTLKTDQDNAIILSDLATALDLDYFHKLAKTINKSLHHIGYNYCEGGIMASNEAWCQPLQAWKKQFSYWINSPDPQNILDSSIFFDFRRTWGESNLVDELRMHVNNEVKENGLFFYHMAGSIIKFKPVLESETANLKKILLPLIGFIRIYSLQNQLVQTNSIERLELLTKKQIFSPERENELIHIYNFLMQLRLKHQAIALLENESAENEIALQSLSHIEQNILKKSHKEIGELQLELSLTYNKMA
jgi:signal-transduction protein with cAMP-binding, CBS, and nucleotidyltransferase domain